MAHILVIEDEPGMREVLRKALTQAGHHVSLASNGKEGMNRLVGATPSLVITDILMPEKDGIETIIEIRKTHPQMKIIAVSGGGRAKFVEFLEIANRAGADAVLQKPFRMAELLDRVNRLLGVAG